MRILQYSLSLVLVGCFGLSSFAQDKFAFWKKDREYAENSVSINISGPIPGGGLAFGHQVSKKTTFVAFYGQAQEVEFSGDDLEIGDLDGNNEIAFTGKFGDENNSSSWAGGILQYRPFEKAQGVRLAAGAGVGRLSGTLQDPDQNSYQITGGGPFVFLGAGYGLRPVKGLQLGFDIGLIRLPGFDVNTNSVSTPNSINRSENIRREFNSAPYIPNAQITIGWGF